MNIRRCWSIARRFARRCPGISSALARMRNSIPGGYDEAYRWVAEMEEISDSFNRTAVERHVRSDC
jgi:hypothetical protein